VVLAGPGGTVTPPAAPTGLTVTGVTSTSVSLSWTGSAGATGYKVYRGTNVTTVTGTSATITGLAASTTYSFQVSATNSAGESAKSGAVSATTSSGTGTPPPTPTGLTVTGVTSTSVSLAWNASAGATGYKVYRGTSVTTVTGTSATIGGLAASTTYSFQVSATNASGESARSATVSATTAGTGGGGGSPRSWPYIDITMSTPAMADVARATGQKFFTLAFVIGNSAGCVPSWGGTIDLHDARITQQIADLRALGGDVAVSFGGAIGPYLQQTCPSQAQQVGAIEQVIDAFHLKRIDFDIEASVPLDTMNKAIAQVQRERAGTTVSYTLMVQGDDYGLTPALGVDLLKNAKANGVNVGIVNPMTMDFGSSREWGDAVIAASNATLGQMAQIWPEVPTATLHRMLGVTPMIGRNDTGPIFSIADGQKLVTWANNNHIGSLGFWSVGRDNGDCPGGGVSPTCSSISQSRYQFTSIFGGFTG
jgi:chitodextrinase